jgi:hypothetical protein
VPAADLHHVLLESPHEFVTPLILHPACSVLALMIKVIDPSRIRRCRDTVTCCRMLWTQNLLIQCGNIAITVGANRRIMGCQTAEDEQKNGHRQ